MAAVLYMHKQFCRAVHQLTVDEQNAVKSTIVDYMNNPKLPGLHWHRLDKCKDADFASIRSSRDIRLILHPCLDGEIICYVDHHDAAYDWAEKRSLKFDKKTGEIQLYSWPIGNECPFQQERTAQKPLLFCTVSDADLKWYGVPDEWIGAIRQINDVEQVLELTDSLPERTCEALMSLAEGKRPSVARASKREVIRIEDSSCVDKLVDMSWDEWSVYLHPSQEEIVKFDAQGDFLVTGGPGTGKTVVALHRTAARSRNGNRGRVVLLTTSCALASRMRQQIKWLDVDVANLDILTIREYAVKLLKRDNAHIIPSSEFDELIRQIADETFTDDVYGIDELRNEYTKYIEDRHFDRRSYLSADRSPCRLPLKLSQREVMYDFMSRVSESLRELSYQSEYSVVAEAAGSRLNNDYGEIIVDECQNLTAADWRFVEGLKKASSICDVRLCLFGDANQRIVGVEFPSVEKTFKLTVNYRSSEKIDKRASMVLGNTSTGCHSLFRGIAPILHQACTKEKEKEYIVHTLNAVLAANKSIRNCDVAFFVHDASQISRAEEVLETCGVPYVSFYDGTEFGEKEIDAVTIATYNQAPGLEYRIVFMMGCEDGIVPPRDISNDDYERRLLYVVMTRARDVLIISGAPLLSEFLRGFQRQTIVGCEESLAHFVGRRDRRTLRKQQVVESIVPIRQQDDNPCASEEPKRAQPVCNAIIAKQYIKALYHMASLQNIKSLLGKGLLSKHEIVREGISYADISNQDVQNKREQKCDTQFGRNLHDYASLYINPRNAMLYTVQKNWGPVFILEIDLAVLDETSFVFTNANATCYHARFFRDLNMLNELNWAALQSRNWYGQDVIWKQQMQAEFLVHPKVLPRFIKAVLCRTENDMKLIKQTIGNDAMVRQESTLFF